MSIIFKTSNNLKQKTDCSNVNDPANGILLDQIQVWNDKRLEPCGLHLFQSKKWKGIHDELVLQLLSLVRVWDLEALKGYRKPMLSAAVPVQQQQKWP